MDPVARSHPEEVKMLDASKASCGLIALKLLATLGGRVPVSTTILGITVLWGLVVAPPTGIALGGK